MCIPADELKRAKQNVLYIFLNSFLEGGQTWYLLVVVLVLVVVQGLE
jgi:hypothetical protein